MSYFKNTMTYKVEETDNKRIVHLDGEVDMEVADKARNTILPLIEAGHEVHLNLSKVEYMDSSGISVLIESKKLSEQKNTKFELIEISKPVEKYFYTGEYKLGFLWNGTIKRKDGTIVYKVINWKKIKQ